MATLDKSFCHSEHTRFLHIAYRRKLGAGEAQLLRKEALRYSAGCKICGGRGSKRPPSRRTLKDTHFAMQSSHNLKQEELRAHKETFAWPLPHDCSIASAAGHVQQRRAGRRCQNRAHLEGKVRVLPRRRGERRHGAGREDETPGHEQAAVAERAFRRKNE